jgi:choline kinase
MKAIILAAGIGKKISKQLPKCLIPLPAGKTIIGNQIEILRAKGGEFNAVDISDYNCVEVDFKEDLEKIGSFGTSS